MFNLGIERLTQERDLRQELKGKRVALIAHPASTDKDLKHSVDILKSLPEINLTCAFGPQHGLKGEKQYNMIETDDEIHPVYKIPVFSLYGKVRRPTAEMLSHFDVAVVDLQDVGCRIYTYIATTLYMMQECAKLKKQVWVLDRPNPIGRPIEGPFLKPGWESFVGSGPLPIRHGLTIGEIANWFKDHFKLDLDLKIVTMKNYNPLQGPGFGWPSEMPWVNPSPNAPNLTMTRCFPGTVTIEGTHLTEGRGTTRPLEVVGAPDIDGEKILKEMYSMKADWMKGFASRACYFEPTFYKHKEKLCRGIQFHPEGSPYDHEVYKPYRVMALFYKCLRKLYPDYQLWRKFTYEYESERLAIDLINGSSHLREWVDDKSQSIADFENHISGDEKAWTNTYKEYWLY